MEHVHSPVRAVVLAVSYFMLAAMLPPCS